MSKYKYHPMHMHIHTCHQQGGSMESHIYNAASLGMQYIRFTDHDTRTGDSPSDVKSFDFSKGTLVYNDFKDEECGWKLVGSPSVSFEDSSFVVKGEQDTRSLSGIEFYSSGKRHNVSLIADVTLALGLQINVPEGEYAAIDIRLSKRPPFHKTAHYRYVCGECKGGDNPLLVERKTEINSDGIYVLKLSEDIAAAAAVGGIDNVFDTVSLLVSSGAEIKVRSMSISAVHRYDDVIRRQRVVADEIGARYGVKPFVTSEISGAGQHKNCFDTKVPIINYADYSYKMTEREACDHVVKHGGIFAYNHPFENNKYKKMNLTREEVEREVITEAANLIAKRVHGATLMEVGFVDNRGKFTLDDYLKLWDIISLSGIFITGYGDSDSHHSNKGWFSGNNFATWIAADKDLEFPISEEVFIESMKSGRVYMGDPVFLHSDIEFTADGNEMGSVFYSTKTRKCFFRASSLTKGDKVRIIINGSVSDEYVIESDGEFTTTYDLVPDRTVSFSRVEIYNADGRCIMLTNPIYIADPDYYVGDIATERVVANDTLKVTGKYLPEINIPSTASEIKRTKLLHIGDTASREYPYYKKMIEAVKPDVILHTGDLSDEVKVGRIPGTKNEYISKIKVLADMLNSSGARLIIVPGNNDLPADIGKLFPTAEVLDPNSITVIDGVECRVGHMVHKITYDKLWHFYGHGFTGEEWDYSYNEAGKPCRFNACLGSFICSLAEDKFCIIPLPKIKDCDVV